MNERFAHPPEIDRLLKDSPYVKAFADRILVVKYGGSALTENDLKEQVIFDVVALARAGLRPAIVHGGGKRISRALASAGLSSKFVSGMRVTSGDLIHADQHGAVVIPWEVAEQVPAAAADIARREAVIIGAAQEPGFDMERLRKAWGDAAEIH